MATDEEGHIIYSVGQDLNVNYKIIKILGVGTFGKVLRCLDNRTGAHVAVKVIRAVKKYSESASFEIEILKRIASNNEERLFVQFHDSFEHNSHVCIATEELGLSLYELLKKNKYHGFSLGQIQVLGYQLIKSLEVLHNRIKLIHTDLKPENILLVEKELLKSDIKRVCSKILAFIYLLY
ncbi:MAG: putative Serine/threonine-protein kinase AFC3 [Streblomastix strix]|uniref:Putative Serine/threonine-protein kinase AFC3 n=1 Tax=Streblomastix strix TaxID=222440 RepID=A0A5J4WEH5_9EUKA|nr:MAG: putative Serine/threonine-protein kinase AFC3 [Streblomastix strix]